MALRHWSGESTAVARLERSGATHLIDAEGLAVLDAVASDSNGMPLREIAHALGVGSDADPGVDAGLQCIIDGLIQSGLLRRVDDEANPGPQSP